jgi:hypothetical protein
MTNELCCTRLLAVVDCNEKRQNFRQKISKKKEKTLHTKIISIASFSIFKYASLLSSSYLLFHTFIVWLWMKVNSMKYIRQVFSVYIHALIGIEESNIDKPWQRSCQSFCWYRQNVYWCIVDSDLVTIWMSMLTNWRKINKEKPYRSEL